MKDANTMQMLAAALNFHRAGRLNDAERLYRQILAGDKDNPDALRAMGLLAHQVGRPDAARKLLRRAIQVDPKNANPHNTLGEVMRALHDLDAAERSYRAALAINPQYPEAHNNLGIVLAEREKLGEAQHEFRQAISLRPEYLNAYVNLGNSLLKSGHAGAAVEAFRTALRLNPNHPTAHGGLAASLQLLNRSDEALAECDTALRITPNDADLHQTRARLLRELGRLEEAIAAYRHTIVLSPNDAHAHNNLGEALRVSGNFSAACAQYRRAIEIDPRWMSEAHSNLGAALGAMGDHGAAMESLRKALEVKPNNLSAHSNLLMEFNYVPTDPQIVFEEHLKFDAEHAAPLRETPYVPKRKPIEGRAIRIGYVSPDFRHHAVANFIEPILQAHDRSQFHIICYNDTILADQTTNRLRSYANEWRDIGRLNDEQLLTMIRGDEVDVLVDLAGHTSRNRMLVFGQRAAPIQVSYLGYPNTTGLATMDDRFTDDLADPPGLTEKFYTEKLARLPGGFLRYRPPDEAPEVAPPRAERGHITFGSFNNLAKISGETLAAWAEILSRVPNARLMIKAIGLGEEPTRDFVRTRLASHGLPVDRVDLVAPEFYFAAHLARYGEIDIALDTFPYNGTTTTCEALWMGVPVVTVAGNSHASRVGVSLLTHRGLPHLIAPDVEHYIALAVDLAQNAQRLSREEMRASPLLDAASLVREIENAYRSVCIA